MGVLAGIGNSVGSAFAGMGTAGGAASGSMALGTLATGTNVAGNILEGIGAQQQANFQASVARQNASAALMAGQQAESASKMKYGALGAQEKAAQAANGISVNSGSALAVREGTAQVGAMDAALIHYNAAREAYGQNEQAALDVKAGQGAMFKGLLQADTSLLSGASSLGSKWLGYQLSGASNPSVNGPF